MSFQLTDMLLSSYSVIVLVGLMLVLVKLPGRGSKLDAFPTVGSSTSFPFWWDGLRFLTNARDLIQAGYKKHSPAPFKIIEFSHWTVILSDRTHLEELARASNEELSYTEASHDVIQTKYTFGHDVLHNPSQIAVVQTQLTRNIEVLYPEIRDEIAASFDDILSLSGNEWKSVAVFDAVERIVCRTSSRAFVGLPLCRNPDWIDLNVRYIMDIIMGGLIVWSFPEFMRSLATRFLTNIPQDITRGLQLLGPIIKERQKYLDEYGEKWDEKPNDLLSWLMSEAQDSPPTIESLTRSVLFINFAAISRTSSAFTQALFHLAANPQYVRPLREEVEAIIEKYGWTKTAIGKMRKIDSYLKEFLRVEGLILTSLWRKALVDFRFSDGTLIPKGTLVAAASQCLHRDEKFYANPEIFEPFRFADLQEEHWQRHQFAAASTEYLPFGLGRSACPGRFFAAAEVKTMLAHVIAAYDLKLENDATQTCFRIGTLVLPNPQAKIMFRNRTN